MVEISTRLKNICIKKAKRGNLEYETQNTIDVTEMKNDIYVVTKYILVFI